MATRIILILVALAVAGRAFERIALMRAKNNASFGQLVDIGGRRLHLKIAGVGTPVVFEAGNTNLSADWALMAEDVSRFATAVVYDRAGYLWSDRGPRPRTLHQMVEDLRTALDAANVSSPRVFVGLSMGASIAQVYATTHPGDVAGLVLLDSGSDMFRSARSLRTAQAQETSRRRMRGIARRWRFVAILAPFGITRLVIRFLTPSPQRHLWARFPSDIRGALQSRYQRKSCLAFADEHEATVDSIAALPDSPIRLDVPTIVVTADEGSGFDLHHFDMAEQTSTNSEWRYFRDCPHEINAARPELGVAAIRDAVEAVQTGAQLARTPTTRLDPQTVAATIDPIVAEVLRAFVEDVDAPILEVVARKFMGKARVKLIGHTIRERFGTVTSTTLIAATQTPNGLVADYRLGFKHVTEARMRLLCTEDGRVLAIDGPEW